MVFYVNCCFLGSLTRFSAIEDMSVHVAGYYPADNKVPGQEKGILVILGYFGQEVGIFIISQHQIIPS